MEDRGLFITSQAIHRQLAAMPNELYLIRLIHRPTRRPFPGERLWTATELLNTATVRFLRARNREGCDVYILPFAGQRNAGYILVDLDRADGAMVESMRVHGHDPCVVLETSPGHLQAWVHISSSPLEPRLTTALGKRLARAYGGDLARTDCRHLGRLAGFTNQGSAQESDRDSTGVLSCMWPSKYTDQVEGQRLDANPGMAWLSSLPARNRRKREDLEALGTPKTRQPQADMFRLRSAVGDVDGCDDPRSTGPAVLRVSDDGRH